MTGRARLCPYYFAQGENEVKLSGVPRRFVRRQENHPRHARRYPRAVPLGRAGLINARVLEYLWATQGNLAAYTTLRR